MSAALAAADAGMRVVILEARPYAGGCFDYRAWPYNEDQPLFARSRELAEQVEKAVADRSDLQMRPIHVVKPDRKTFSLAFYDLLVSELVSRGLQVSIEKVDTVVLEYEVQIVSHSYRGQRPPFGLLTAIGAGVAVARHLDKVPSGYTNIAIAAGALGVDALLGFVAAESDSEVIITTSLTEANRYVMRDSSIYYINDPDVGHYAGAGEVEPVSVRVVND